MKKTLLILSLLFICCQITMAEEITLEQTIENTKSYTGVNYNRQDSKQTGTQKIVNDHSWFNINIQIIKEGVLFSKDKNTTDTDVK